MADAFDPIDKKTLLLRLSVSIFKMTEQEVYQLITLLEQESNLDNPPTPLIQADDKPAGSLQHQMLIARFFVLIQQMDQDSLLKRLKHFNHPDLHIHRNFPRIECNLLVDFAVQGKAYQGYMRDISAGGIFIITSEQFQIGQEIRICFTLNQSTHNLPLKITGTVKRNYRDGVGIQYQTISVDQQSVIHSMVQNKLRSV